MIEPIYDNGVRCIQYIVQPKIINESVTKYKDGWMYCNTIYYEAFIGRGADKHYRKITQQHYGFINQKDFTSSLKKHGHTKI